jgi:hypothetical protein
MRYIIIGPPTLDVGCFIKKPIETQKLVKRRRRARTLAIVTSSTVSWNE